LSPLRTAIGNRLYPAMRTKDSTFIRTGSIR
jgi:hypothetical protein